MRLHHVIRSFKIAALLSAVATIAALPASAMTIDSPTEGRAVRDKVKIVIPRASLPVSGTQTKFLTVKIDGRFHAAIEANPASTDGKAPVNPNIVYIWDTKQLINDPLLPEDQRRYKDGMHEILIEAHGIGAGDKDIITDSAKVTVNLKNLIARADPAPPIRLNYRYHLGQQSTYRVSTSAEILDPTGYSLTGGMVPLRGRFDVFQSIEDIQPDGAALIRYKVERNSAFTQTYGQLTGLMQQFNSVYKLIDITGRTIDDNVLASKLGTQVTDCLIRLPRQPIQVGDMWSTSFKMKLEGLAPTTKFEGAATLDALEWDSGFECARISSNLTGDSTFGFFGPTPARVNATNTSYFAYKVGKLIRDTTVIEFTSTMDTATLASIQQQMSMGADTTGGMSMPSMPGSSVSSAPSPSRGPLVPSGNSSGLGMPTPVIGAPSGSSMPSSSPSYGAAAGPSVRSVTVRIVISKELRQ